MNNLEVSPPALPVGWVVLTELFWSTVSAVCGGYWNPDRFATFSCTIPTESTQDCQAYPTSE